MKFTPSSFQQAIIDWVINGRGNGVSEAVAGSGKSTTLLELIKLVQNRGSTLLCAFNKSIQKELEAKLADEGIGRRVSVKTFHGFGLSLFYKNLRGIKVEIYDRKFDDLLAEVVTDKVERRRVYGTVKKIVGLCKGLLLSGNMNDIDFIVRRYNVDTDSVPSDELLSAWTHHILRRSLEMDNVIDFDDMIYIPAMKLESGEWSPKTFDWIFPDEVQDMNKAQRVILLHCLRPMVGRMFAVGDSSQSIYGFRGADPAAMDELKKELNAEILPLSICYRCPTSHIELAKQYVPAIEPREGAPEGIVETVTFSKAMQMMKDRDLVLCRRNAPLVGAAFALISEGKKAMVKGRDIGKGLTDLIDKMEAESYLDLLDKLNEHEKLEVAKWIRLERFSKAEQVQDQVECILTIATGLDEISELKAKIERIFSDNVYGTVFSSVHRAKGLEAHRVFILERETMPLKWRGQQDWEFQQELNILYVALTRSKSEMYFVESNNGDRGQLKEAITTETTEDVFIPVEQVTDKTRVQVMNVLRQEVSLLEKDIVKD